MKDNNVQHLANNERYRLLKIDGEAYLMDIESSFWRVVFPFFFWLLPNYIFKVEKSDIIEKLKTEKMQAKGGSFFVLVTGLSYTGGILLAPLMDYFNVSISDFLRNALLIFAVIGVAILYLLVSHYRKRKLYSVLELDTLPQSKIWLRPSSVGHLVNVLFSFLFWFTASVFSFSVYIVSKNIMILALSLLVLFGGFLMVNRKVVKEGKLAVKYRIDEGIKNDV
ncbi:MAG TPA: DUF443 family protein [Candidatus Avamphibacillus sp.]|nr:DUF443 family protein [Candidatus Avamphibacillus sp.]